MLNLLYITMGSYALFRGQTAGLAKTKLHYIPKIDA